MNKSPYFPKPFNQVEKMIRKLSSRDYYNFIQFCQVKDKFSDFYIFQGERRVYLDNLEVADKVFRDCLIRGDKCFVSEENGIIKGLLLVIGYSSKSDKKYLKVLYKDNKTLRDLFKILHWNFKSELFVSLSKGNPLVNDYQRLFYKDAGVKKFYFTFQGLKNNEVQLKYTPDKRQVNYQFFRKEEDS